MAMGESARAARVAPVLDALASQSMQAVWVDRAPVFDKTTLMHALYQALEFPGWFGFNWDALEDALFDAGDAGSPLVLLFADLELLEQRDPDSARTFLDIVATVAADPETALTGIVRVADFSPPA